eukprot:TRINITY_DN2944_c0_g1_i2.p1 TRINITY_DN2944_c0_g1~~TRINITY_DN2944_c0_g1_i2.p1  ORF type:complete len:504 (+),score=124.51 TRINITY_DN2944_c0_g1_i2:136-1647(+)
MELGREWDLYKELMSIVDQLSARDCQYAFAAVQKVCESVWGGDVKVTVTGSYLQQTAIMSSDLDVGLVMPKRMKCLDDPHYLTMLLKYIQSHPDLGLEKQEEFFQATVPLVRLHHAHSGLTIDISVSSEYTGITDSHIASLINLNPHILPTIYIVKHWAQRRKVVGAYVGFLNSVSWVALVLSFCQMRNLIPPLKDALSWDATQVKQQPTADLLCAFYEWVGGLGVPRGKQNYGLRCNLETGVRSFEKSEKPLLLEDPGKPGNLLSSSTRRSVWDDITGECRRAAEMIKRGKNFSDVLEADGGVDVIPNVGVCTSAMGEVSVKPKVKAIYRAPGRKCDDVAEVMRGQKELRERGEDFTVGSRVVSLDLRIEGANKSLQGYKGTVTDITDLRSGKITVKFDSPVLGDMTLSPTKVSLIPADDTISETSSSSAESTIFSHLSSNSSSVSPTLNLGIPFHAPAMPTMPTMPNLGSMPYFMPPMYPVPMMPPDCAINPVNAPIRKIG